MAKDPQIICSNVFKNSNKDVFRQEFNKKIIEGIKQLENNKSCIGKMR